MRAARNEAERTALEIAEIARSHDSFPAARTAYSASSCRSDDSEPAARLGRGDFARIGGHRLDFISPLDDSLAAAAM